MFSSLFLLFSLYVMRKRSGKGKSRFLLSNRLTERKKVVKLEAKKAL